MPKKIVVAACALLLLGVGLGPKYFEIAKWMSNADDTGVAASPPQSVVPRESRNPRSELPEVFSGKLHQSGDESTKPLASSSPRETTGSKTENSVIGNPFPVSTSVQNSCKPNPLCDRMKAALKEMGQEGRDDAWATDMEDKLKEYSVSFGPDKYTVRSVECRESLCAIEVASAYGLLPLGLPYSYGGIFDSDLKLWDSWTGRETDQLGTMVTVTLQMYRRR
jgi:hypothetical protein